MADSLPHRLPGQVQEIPSGRRGRADNQRDCFGYRGEIRNRDRNDGHGQEPYPPSLRSTSQTLTRTDRTDIQEHHGPGDIYTKALGQKAPLGRRVLDRRLLCGNCRRKSRLENNRAICPEAGFTKTRPQAVAAFWFLIPCSLLQGGLLSDKAV